MRAVWELLLLVCVVTAAAAAGKQKDLYSALGLKSDASSGQIKGAYRKLSLQYHPDKNAGNAAAQERFREISHAYEILGDEDKRTIYDEFGEGEQFTNRYQYMQAKGGAATNKDFYTKVEDIVKLNARTFWPAIRKDTILVEFYAPWCVHCQQMVGEFRKATLLLEGVSKVGAVNCEKEANLCAQIGIHGYPTMRLFQPATKGKAAEQEDYTGQQHTAEAIYSWVKQSQSAALVTLTPATFPKQVQQSKDMWLIDFSAGAWCGPCTSVRPHMRKLAAELEGVVKVGILDCDNARDLCGSLGVQYFPQIRLFSPSNTGGELLEANGHFPALNILTLFKSIISAASRHTFPQPVPETPKEGEEGGEGESEGEGEGEQEEAKGEENEEEWGGRDEL